MAFSLQANPPRVSAGSPERHAFERHRSGDAVAWQPPLSRQTPPKPRIRVQKRLFAGEPRRNRTSIVRDK